LHSDEGGERRRREEEEEERGRAMRINNMPH